MHVQWEKLSNNAVEKTIWAQSSAELAKTLSVLDQGGIFELMEVIFAKKPAPSPATAKEKKERKVEIQVLDPKKAYNINIALLVKFKRDPFSAVRAKILSSDETFLTENLLNQLLRNAPTAEEAGKLSIYVNCSEDEMESLARPDAFCVEMLKIYRYRERIENMLFMVTFKEKYGHLRRNMTTLMKASTSLRLSNATREMLSLILLMGNYINGTSYQGGAHGIKISSINKLVDTKSQNSSTTLLHVLANTIESNFPHVLQILDDLKEAGDACKITLQDLTKDYADLKMSMETLTNELATHFADVQPEKDNEDLVHPLAEVDNFGRVGRNFLKDAVPMMTDLKSWNDNMDSAYRDVVSFFGEDPAVMKSDEFFGIFKTFTTSFEKCLNDNRSARVKKEAMEKRKREREEQQGMQQAERSKFALPTNTPIEGTIATDEDRTMIDNLLERLRSTMGSPTKSGRISRGANREDRRPSDRERERRLSVVNPFAANLLRSLQNDEEVPSSPRANRENSRGFRDSLQSLPEDFAHSPGRRESNTPLSRRESNAPSLSRRGSSVSLSNCRDSTTLPSTGRRDSNTPSPSTSVRPRLSTSKSSRPKTLVRSGSNGSITISDSSSSASVLPRTKDIEEVFEE